jgi:predicted secreted Zn-dependent protease
MQQYEFNRKTFKKDINEIYQDIVRQKEEMQASYDGETDHSRKRKTQYDWFEKIDELLQETAPYAQYP